MEDHEFIKQCSRRVVTIPNQKIEIVIERNGEKRVFTVTQYLEVLVRMYYSIIDEEKGNIAKLNKCAEAKREVKHHIREYKANEYLLPENYKNIDYSIFLTDIDDTYELLFTRVENEKKEIEIKNLNREKIKFFIGLLSGASIATLGWLTFYFHFIKHFIKHFI